MVIRMNSKLDIKPVLCICICLTCLLILAATAQTLPTTEAQSAQAYSTYIPITGGDNYYNFYGGPELEASVNGNDMFNRGDTVTLLVSLANYGRIIGFKQAKTPTTPTEYALANAEQQEEAKITNALNVKATLLSNTTQIEVQSGDQLVESLMAGQITTSPLRYTLQIANHAPAGLYPMTLRVSYDYQSNVEVYAANLANIQGLPPVFVNGQWSYFYNHTVKNLTVPVVVKEAADFEVVSSKANTTASATNSPIEVTYRNIGDQPVTDAVARLSFFTPFSSTDDQAYLGNMTPGEEKTVLFRVDVASGTTAKEYGVNSEIKYTDVRGATALSEVMMVPVTVNPSGSSILIPAVVVVVLIAAIGGYWYLRRQKGKKA
ncbi:MAG: hypothetical protein WB392_09545 [Methanotrichaceae archaeon]